MDEILALLRTDSGVAAMGVSIIAGSLGGLGLATLHRSALRPFRRAMITAGIVLWLGGLYFVSLMVAILGTGQPVAPVFLALTVIWILFTTGVFLGAFTAFMVRLR